MNSEIVTAGEDVFLPMDLDEAVKADHGIVHHATNLRQLLITMYERSGWATLGFASWDKYLEDVAPRAGLGNKYLRKIHNVARLESGTGHDLGTFKEGTLRPIVDTLSGSKGFTETDRKQALELAIELAGSEEELTNKTTQAASWFVYVERKTPRAGYRLVERMRSGEVSPKVANEINHVMQASKSEGIEHILAEVSDSSLAHGLANVYSTNGEVWQELGETIELSGTMPTGSEKQVPVGKATSGDLQEFLSAPGKLKRYEKVVERNELLKDIANAAAKMMIEYYGVSKEELPKAFELDDEGIFETEKTLYVLLQKAGLIR
jgi:hypothetical protein